MKKKRKQITTEQVKSMRQEYLSNQHLTIEYMADKYDRSLAIIQKILENKLHIDPEYVRPIGRKGGGTKRAVFIPEHILDDCSDVPGPTTLHRARGHNHVINKFS